MSENNLELESQVTRAKSKVDELKLELDAAGDASGDAGEATHEALDAAVAELARAQGALELSQEKR